MSHAPAESLEANLSGQYDVALDTLADLGFASGTIKGRIAPLPELLDSLTGPQTTALEERWAAGITDSLNVAPLVQNIGVMGKGTRPGLIPRFNRLQVGELGPTDEYSLRSIMNYFARLEIGDRDPIHDNGAEGRWPVAIVLEDSPDSPFLKPADRGGQDVGVVYETGGYYTDRWLPSTQRDLEKEIAQAAAAGYVLKGANMAQVVVRAAQIRRQEQLAGRQSLINREGMIADLRGAGNVGLLYYPWIHRAANLDPIVPVIENEYYRLEMRTTADVHTAASSVTGVMRVMPIEPR